MSQTEETRCGDNGMNTEVQTIDIEPGTSIADACLALAEHAAKSGPARMDFNGLIVEAKPGDSPGKLCERWLKLSREREQQKRAEAEAAEQALKSLVARLTAQRDELLSALVFIADLTAEALETARVGTGEEVALRHARRRANEALKNQGAN